ncbi:hypothetical protein EVAR_88468_1 [Eumeta japonica]|uniref:Uncharacterized protein n=1 Tax=Eumeta variegata TaxID=151549 RepID=A0A4C1XS90_EUMVA|nr:hypothetical protein EVAR_88468_1 [Eumeta japonica]
MPVLAPRPTARAAGAMHPRRAARFRITGFDYLVAIAIPHRETKRARLPRRFAGAELEGRNEIGAGKD